MRSEWAVSVRRACAAIQLDPKTYRYSSRRPDQAALEQRIREICQTPSSCRKLIQAVFYPLQTRMTKFSVCVKIRQMTAIQVY